MLPNGADPAEYLTRPDSTLHVFRDTDALPLLTVQVQQAISAQGDRIQWIEGRLSAARSIAKYLATYPVSHSSRQISWISWISNILDLDPMTFTRELAQAYQSGRGGTIHRVPARAVDVTAITI